MNDELEAKVEDRQTDAHSVSTANPIDYPLMPEPQPLDYASPSTDSPPPKGALKIIFFIVFMDLLGFGLIIPLLPLYADVYHASAFEVGLLFSIYSACQFVASPILGIISDRHGRRPVLVFSQMGSAIGYLLLGIVMTLHWNNAAIALWLIYVSRFIDGISGGNISTAQAYISDVTPPQNRARGMAIIGAAFGLGFALGPAFSALLVVAHPSLPGYAAAIMSTGAMVTTFFKLPESRVHRPAEAGNLLHPSRYLPILRNGRLVELLLIGFFSMTGFVMLESMVALFLHRPETFAFGDWQVGLYYAYLGIIIAGVQGGAIGKLTKRFGEWKLAIVGPIFVALGMAMIAYTGYKPLLSILLIGGAINAVGRSLQTPNLYALISQNADPRQQGLTFGLNQGIQGIARIIGPIIASVAYTWWSGGPFLTACGISLCMAIWTVFLRLRSPDAQPTPLPPDALAAEST